MTEATRLLSVSPVATEGIGAELAARLHAGDVLLLEGDLAAGKTTLVRGLVRGLGGDPERVTSPSFVLVQSYPCAAAGVDHLHHVDLYRLADRLPDLRELGLEEILSEPRAVVAVEWPRDTLSSWIPSDARVWRVRLTVDEGNQRVLEITPPG